VSRDLQNLLFSVKIYCALISICMTFKLILAVVICQYIFVLNNASLCSVQGVVYATAVVCLLLSVFPLDLCFVEKAEHIKWFLPSGSHIILVFTARCT